MVVAKEVVLAFPVPSVKRMIANHIQGRFGKLVFQDLEQVFVMAPRQVDPAQSATGFVDARFRVEPRIALVFVGFEEFGVDDPVVECTTDRVRIADHRSLGFAE